MSFIFYVLLISSKPLSLGLISSFIYYNISLNVAVNSDKFSFASIILSFPEP